MAHDAHDHGHGHGGEAGDHVPHVLPLKFYFGTAGALFVLTAITVGVSYFHFGELNLIIALAVATVKATIVSAIFMHLFWDHKFHSIIFASSLIFLGIFIWFTMYDTNHRGQNDFVQKERPADPANPWKGDRKTDVQNRATKGVATPQLPQAYEPTLK
jgi:cytochrome c oxidase subunit 4